MNYYKRHLGDYAKDTGHLTALEHGIYTLLLDWYYTTEKPIPSEKAIRIARGNPQETDSVLREFFTLCDEGWRHARADREIAEYHKRAEVNRATGKLGGRPRKTESVSKRNPEETLATSHKPLAITEAKAESKSGAPSAKRGCRLPVDWQPSDEDVTFAVEHRVDWRREADAFRDFWFSKPGAQAVKLDWSATWRNWVRRSTQRVAVTTTTQKSKTYSAIERIARMTNERPVAGSGNRQGLIEADVPSSGRLPFGGHDRGNGSGMD
jgi:uncharacterized protein YdaU (DUF1376 family)